MATKVFRFALGTAAAPYSGLWRAWTHEDELHLAVRAATDEVALTVYPTGRWRITVGTAVSRWTRPKEFRPGWSRGPDLVIPYTVTPVQMPASDAHPTEPITWLPPSAPGFQARFSLLVATPSAEASHWRPQEAAGTESLASLPLRTAGTLHLYRVDELTTPDHPAPPDHIAVGPLPNPATTLIRGPSRLVVIISADQAGCPSFRESHEA
ncbi:MAG: hypothetical protein ABI587_04325 [Gemmatimonadales bacterium]